ncbi:hypothetical protein F5141DRAFT_999053, partial [Pisolithus sp. B1]
SGRPVIPERGEKDFEPVHGRDSDLQLHDLDQARGAMFETLRPQRGISSMGHPISRASGIFGSMEAELGKSYKTEKRLDLLPEEAIYVIEREVLFCYRSIPSN